MATVTPMATPKSEDPSDEQTGQKTSQNMKMNDAVAPTKSAGTRTTRLPYQSEMCPASRRLTTMPTA